MLWFRQTTAVIFKRIHFAKQYARNMETLPQIFSTGWASGVNAYATVFVLGLLHRMGVDQVPEALGRPEVLVFAGVLFAIELVVDKVPYLDSGWDAVHTAIRPTVGTILGVLISSDSGNVSELLGGSTGGGTALLTHLVKAGLRLTVNVRQSRYRTSSSAPPRMSRF